MRLILAAAIGALVGFAGLRVRHRLDLLGYESGHSEATGHHPWWFHQMGTRRCVLCVLGYRKPASPETDDPADGVQPADPWPPMVSDNVEPARGGPMPSDPAWWLDRNHCPDPSYLEATALAAIRRSAQSSIVTTEGMS